MDRTSKPDNQRQRRGARGGELIAFPVAHPQSGPGDDGGQAPPAEGGAGAPGQEAAPAAETRVFAVTSGKGGVGKSFISSNLSLALASRGRRVLLVDADLGLANLDILFGIKAEHTMSEVLSGKVGIKEAVVRVSPGVNLLPACPGKEQLATLAARERHGLFDAIDSLERHYDTVLIDTGSGIGGNAVAFAAAAQQTMVVMTPDPTSLSDAYAMIKVLSQQCGVRRVYVVVNRCNSPRDSGVVLERLLGLVDRFLDVSVVPVGCLYQDDAVSRSVQELRPLFTSAPDAVPSVAIASLAGRLLGESPPRGSWGAPRIFWKKVIGAAHEEVI